MSAVERLQHRPWWQHAPGRTHWQRAQEPAGLAHLLAPLLDRAAPDPDPLLVPRMAVTELEACFCGTRERRDAHLRALWLHHAPATISSVQRIGVPGRLWERLLDGLGARRLPGKRCWLGAEEAEGMLHHGMSSGGYIEWWGVPEVPGATYDDRLWAWGAVQPLPGMEGRDPGALSSRLVWRSDGACWQVHSDLARALAAAGGPGPRPRLADGPGYLLACIVDAIAELLTGADYTSRDLSVVWATMLLPVLAPSVEIDEAAPRARPDTILCGTPDYLQTLGFFMLHPRAQTAILAIDRLCTLLLAEDHDSLGLVLDRLGRLGPDTSPAAIRSMVFRLVQEVTEQTLHRRAAARWDGGFGFKLLRKLLRQVVREGAPAFARRWDAAVHGAPGDTPIREVGMLALRLREALSTALWFPGRPPYSGGPIAQQILDLAWMRWIDEDFLG